MDSLWLVLFTITAGFTVSAIIANLYRLLGFRAEERSGRVWRVAVLVIAGPSVIFEMAMRGFLAKEWTPSTFWLATAMLAYWSLAVGLLVLEVAVSF